MNTLHVLLTISRGCWCGFWCHSGIDVFRFLKSLDMLWWRNAIYVWTSKGSRGCLCWSVVSVSEHCVRQMLCLFFTVTWVCRGSHFWGAPPENVFGVSIRMLVIRRDGSYQPGVLSGPVVKCFSSYLELCRCLSFWVRVSKCLMSRFHDDITQTGGLKWCCAECLYLTTFGLWKTFKYDFPVMSANDDCKLILHT